MLKKIVVLALIVSLLSATLVAGPLFSIQKQDGGVLSCLVSLLLDPRLGYMANEKAVNVDLLHLLKFVPIVGQFMPLVYSYTGYKTSGSFSGCCIGLFGWTTANSLDKYNARTIEWLMFIPVVNLFSLFKIITETMGGKTWTEVAKDEHLKK